MGKIYLVRMVYLPNKAETNRLLSFLRGFSDLHIDVEMVFLIPDSQKSKYNIDIPHVTFTYMWEKFPITNRYMKQIVYNINSVRFVNRLEEGDIVIVLDRSRILFSLFNKKGVKVFHEQTEHPDAYHLRTINNGRYKKEIHKLDGLFVISTALKKYYHEELNVDEGKINIINMTVDYNRFNGLEKHPAERYIAYCGTASNNKDGVDELIKSFALVHKKYPEIKLYIIGKTPDKEDRAGNIRLINELGINDHVVFTGIVQASKMPQMLKDAAILALDRPDSLQAHHGFPTKLGEYLLTENPVVVTKVGDIPLFIKDGETGLLAEERNPKEFSDKLIWVLEHPAEAAAIGKRGAALAMREFNYLNETKKILSAINRYED